MTALLVDLGNSRWKIAHSLDTDIGRVVSGSYDAGTAFTAAIKSSEVEFDRVFVASVISPENAAMFGALIENSLRVPVRLIKATDRMPNVVSGYGKPEQLGVDRLLAMVAARARTSQPLCIVDAGTATTIDFVDQSGQHLGGFILPGLRLFRDCLLANTSIPRDSTVDELAMLGRDTPTGVALGARYAVAGIVERFVSGSGSLFGSQQVQTFVGGGDAPRILNLLPQPCTILSDLVLRGLAVLAVHGDT